MEVLLLIITLTGGLVVVTMTARGIVNALSTTIDVPLYMLGVAVVRGAAPRLLPTGRHRFWTKNVQFEVVDPRSEWIQVTGQELLSKDGAPVRVSATVLRGVSDPLKFAATSSASDRIYVATQLSIRDQVLSRTLDELMEDRQAIAEAIHATLVVEAEPMGVTIERTAIRDLTLIGDTKRAYSEVIQAQLHAKAKLERARGEAAAMRSLLNTAELVRKNPELLQLMTLQQLETGSHEVQIHLGLPATPATGTPNE